RTGAGYRTRRHLEGGRREARGGGRSRGGSAGRAGGYQEGQEGSGGRRGRGGRSQAQGRKGREDGEEEVAALRVPRPGKAWTPANRGLCGLLSDLGIPIRSISGRRTTWVSWR